MDIDHDGRRATGDRSNCGQNRYTPYTKNSCDVLVSFADIGYLSDPHKSCSQIGYVFTMGNLAISWMFTKQTLVATFSNHAKLIALHEVIRGTSGLRSTTKEPTRIYEDNAACIKLMKQGFIKGDNTKYISPKYFYNQQ